MAWIEHKLGYDFDGKKFNGIMVYDDSVKTKRPAIFMEPDWVGASAKAVGQAKLVAGKDYVVYVADMFGDSYSPKDPTEMMAASRAVYTNIGLSRARGHKAMDMFLGEGQKLGLIDATKTAGIGYCFGGGCVLDLARDGSDLKAVVVFHVTYPKSADPSLPSKLKSAVLVLHGADDPVTPRPAIHELEEELNAAKVKWQTVMFSGAVHSFCDPQANAGPTRYDPALAAKSYALMRDFLTETL